MKFIEDMNLHCFPIQYSYHCNFRLSFLVNIVVLLINSVYLVYKFNISKKKVTWHETILIKVRDCCHYTGNYWGAVYLEYSLRCNENNYLQVITYISWPYNNHLTIVKIGEKLKDCHFLCIWKNIEKTYYKRYRRDIKCILFFKERTSNNNR